MNKLQRCMKEVNNAPDLNSKVDIFMKYFPTHKDYLAVVETNSDYSKVSAADKMAYESSIENPIRYRQMVTNMISNAMKSMN